jgi:hypothetical protein
MSRMIALLLMISCSGIGSGAAPGEPGVEEQADTVNEWIEVFADQEWRVSMTGEFSTFSGILRRIPADPMPSYVMRYNPYKLELSSSDTGTVSVLHAGYGELRDIYCGSSDELLPFVGACVEIQGRLNTMEVEGRCFVEIWPVRIREI